MSARLDVLTFSRPRPDDGKSGRLMVRPRGPPNVFRLFVRSFVRSDHEFEISFGDNLVRLEKMFDSGENL